jgi:LmbE family N-acetylglucosaminyl deacetylase
MGAAAAATPGAAGACTGGSLYIAAHEDDPLLFMLPDLGNDILAGRCVRVVILTAGDAGLGQAYFEGREAGLADALAAIARVPSHWRVRDAGIPHHPALLYMLQGNQRVSLVFLQLPDGRFDGDGFDGRGSMKELWERAIPTLTSLAMSPSPPSYAPSTYTRRGLIDAIRWLILDTRPNKIGLQDYVGPLDSPSDHSDHRAGARFSLAAAASYPYPAALVGYIDYAVLGDPVNLSGAAVKMKETAWFAYVPHDNQLSAVCPTIQSCLTPGNYGNYWFRQYTISPTVQLPLKTARASARQARVLAR